MQFSQQEKAKIKDIIKQIDDYINNERKKLRRTIIITIPDSRYHVELVVQPMTGEWDALHQNKLIIGRATYYFADKGDIDDDINCLLYNPSEAMIVINNWSHIKHKLASKVDEQQKELEALHNFKL